MTQTSLIVVQPKLARGASRHRLMLQWHMIGAWSEPLFILDDLRAKPTDGGPTINTYLEVLDVAMDERESVGTKVAIDCRAEEDMIAASIAKILELQPDSDFIVTGPPNAAAIPIVAEHLRREGRSVTVDGNALQPQ